MNFEEYMHEVEGGKKKPSQIFYTRACVDGPPHPTDILFLNQNYFLLLLFPSSFFPPDRSTAMLT